MKKRILTILLALALLCALGGTALGSVRETTEALTYRNITVLLDGKTLVPVDAEGNGVEPFILDASGSTYPCGPSGTRWALAWTGTVRPTPSS